MQLVVSHITITTTPGYKITLMAALLGDGLVSLVLSTFESSDSATMTQSSRTPVPVAMRVTMGHFFTNAP